MNPPINPSLKFEAAKEAYATASDVARRQRLAKLRLWRTKNPDASYLDAKKYEEQLQAEDDVRLAGVSSAFDRERSDHETMSRGFDPRTGARLVDLWGGPINTPNMALSAAIRQNTPGTRTVDYGKYHREGIVQDWGIGGYNSDPNRRIRPANAAARLEHDKKNMGPIKEDFERKAAEQAYQAELAEKIKRGRAGKTAAFEPKSGGSGVVIDPAFSSGNLWDA